MVSIAEKIVLSTEISEITWKSFQNRVLVKQLQFETISSKIVDLTKNKKEKVPFLCENTLFLMADNIGGVTDTIGRFC